MVASADVRVGASDRLFPVAITSFARWFSAGSWFLTRASPAAEPPVVLRERRATLARLRRAWVAITCAPGRRSMNSVSRRAVRRWTRGDRPARAEPEASHGVPGDDQ